MRLETPGASARLFIIRACIHLSVSVSLLFVALRCIAVVALEGEQVTHP